MNHLLRLAERAELNGIRWAEEAYRDKVLVDHGLAARAANHLIIATYFRALAKDR